MISDLEHDLEEVLVFTFADFVLKKKFFVKEINIPCLSSLTENTHL